MINNNNIFWNYLFWDIDRSSQKVSVMNFSVHNGLRLVLMMPTSQAQYFIKYGPIKTGFFFFILQIFSSNWIKYEISLIGIRKGSKAAFSPWIGNCRFCVITIATSGALCCWRESISYCRLFLDLSLEIIWYSETLTFYLYVPIQNSKQNGLRMLEIEHTRFYWWPRRRCMWRHDALIGSAH